MAQYDQLPIYKVTYDMLIMVVHLAKNFPREYKYTIGEKMQNAAIEVIISIYKANRTMDKKAHIEQLMENIQLLYVFLRIANDLKILAREKYVEIVEKVDGISRQAQGWLNNSEKSRESVQAKA